VPGTGSAVEIRAKRNKRSRKSSTAAGLGPLPHRCTGLRLVRAAVEAVFSNAPQNSMRWGVGRGRWGDGAAWGLWGEVNGAGGMEKRPSVALPGRAALEMRIEGIHRAVQPTAGKTGTQRKGLGALTCGKGSGDSAAWGAVSEAPTQGIGKKSHRPSEGSRGAPRPFARGRRRQQGKARRLGRWILKSGKSAGEKRVMSEKNRNDPGRQSRGHGKQDRCSLLRRGVGWAGGST
jgi:hypothetical protein